jgi:hypothetical protein
MCLNETKVTWPEAFQNIMNRVLDEVPLVLLWLFMMYLIFNG